MVAAQFPRNLIAAVPYAIHTVLTDNSIEFTNHARHKHAFHHIFDRVRGENGIERRLTKINHPWTNGQVERMNRAIREGEADQKPIRGIVFPLNVKRFHYDNDDQSRRHLQDFIDAYELGRRLKTLKGLTPYESICERWTLEPERFIIDPIHQMPGLNS